MIETIKHISAPHAKKRRVVFVMLVGAHTTPKINGNPTRTFIPINLSVTAICLDWRVSTITNDKSVRPRGNLENFFTLYIFHSQ
jgi:hypothetical protein